MPKGNYTRVTRSIFIPIGPSIAYIPLSLGLHSLIDSEDAESCGKYNWTAMWNPNLKSYYAYRSSKGHTPRVTIRLHRHITDAPPDLVVDHVNHNTLDNRRSNLKVCTQLENMQNIHPEKIKPRVRKPGAPREYFTQEGKVFIAWKSKGQRWRVRKAVNGKLKQLGSFVTREDAEAFKLSLPS